MGKHQSRPLELLDDIGHDKGFARAGDAQHGLFLHSQPGTLYQLTNGLRLTASRLIIAF